MSVIRAFIAIDLPDQIHQCLDKVADELQARLEEVPVRWVPANNIHLTLKFLGDVSTKNLEVLKNLLETEVSTHESFEISVGGLGAYPKVRRPRVIWAGIEGPPELFQLQNAIEALSTRLGYTPDRRKFSAHLTLGRVSRNAQPGEVKQVGNVLKSYSVGFLGVARVNEVHLFRSDLKPTGAVYTKLLSAKLAD